MLWKSSTQPEPKWLRNCLRQASENKYKVQVMATSSADGGSERFSDVGAHESDLKRWKSWCLAKMNTMSSLPREARGPFVYSMLDEDALFAMEHLEFAEFSIDGGEKPDFQHT